MKLAILMMLFSFGCTTEKVKFIETDITPVSNTKNRGLKKPLNKNQKTHTIRTKRKGSIKDFSFGSEKDYNSDLYRQGRKARFSGGFDSPW